jgi:hypothetical protein
MTIMGMTHLGSVEMSEKNAAAYKKLREMRRHELLPMAKKMKLKVEGFPPSHFDLVEAIARKKGYLNV